MKRIWITPKTRETPKTPKTGKTWKMPNWKLRGTSRQTEGFSLAVVGLLLAVTLLKGGCLKKYMATVNGVHIDEKQFHNQLERTYGVVTLKWMIDKELLFAENDRLNLVRGGEVEEALEHFIHSQFGSDEMFEVWLARNNRTKEDVKNDLKFNLILDRLRMMQVKVSDDALRRFYRKNERRYVSAASVHLLMIQTRNREAVEKARVEMLKGKSFRQVAQRHNENPRLKETGGDAGWQPIDALPPQIREAALSLPLHQVSEPISLGNVWVILMVAARKPGKKLKFEEARKIVEQDFRATNAPPPEQVIQQLEKKAKVNIHSKSYEHLEDLFGIEKPEELFPKTPFKPTPSSPKAPRQQTPSPSPP